jgi:hypothetical protein
MDLLPPDDTPPGDDTGNPEPPTHVFHVVGGRTLFIDRDLGRWRVYDYSASGRVVRLVQAGSPVADYRLFVEKNGARRRRYSFLAGESRELDPARVAAQFAAAVDDVSTPDAG